MPLRPEDTFFCFVYPLGKTNKVNAYYIFNEEENCREKKKKTTILYIVVQWSQS